MTPGIVWSEKLPRYRIAALAGLLSTQRSFNSSRATKAIPRAVRLQATKSTCGLPRITVATKCSGWDTVIAHAAHAEIRPDRSSASPSSTVPIT